MVLCSVLIATAALPVASARASCKESFPTDLASQRAFGLEANSEAASPNACAQACCDAGDACEAWQWCSKSETKPQIENKCFMGIPTLVKATSDAFIGGSRSPAPSPVPPPPLAPTSAPSVAKPSKQQLRFLDQELGMMFHFNMYTFVSQPNAVTAKHADCGQVFNSDLKEMPDPSTFNPTEGDANFVDQWMEAAQSYGAKYAVLTAKHCEGFINFRTNSAFADGSPYGYGVQQSSWRNGEGDLVRDFVDSARRHGISPGLYYSLMGSFYLPLLGENTTKGQRPVSLDEYYNITLTNLREIWTNYGELGELWFDGSTPFRQDAGFQQRVAALVEELQPNAILLQGPMTANGARKGAGETATVNDPNWYQCPNTTACHRTLGGSGLFIPAEGEGCAVGDGNSRQWFWHPDHDDHAALKTVPMFLEEYHASIGRGSNQLMGFTPDRRGLLPSNDVAKAAEVGRFIESCYGNALAKASSQQLAGPEDFIDLVMEAGMLVDRVWLREDITSGQRAQVFQVFARTKTGGSFTQVANGTSVARKRIVIFPEEISPVVIRFQVTASSEWPVPIHEAAVFASCSRMGDALIV